METITHTTTHETIAPAIGGDSHFTFCPREGFDIGWEFASYGLSPPKDAEPEVHQGSRAGASHFGYRHASDDRFVRKYLHLRMSAWRRGRIFDVAVTPEYLKQISTPYCPVTRQALTVATGTGSDWSIDRVINDGGYACGNLVVMATRANIAKDSMSYGELLHMTRLKGPQYGLTPLEWARMAAMVGMSADEHSILPLLVTPPAGMGIANRYALLQFATMRLNFRRTRAEAHSALRDACPGKKAKKAMEEFLLVAGKKVVAKVRTPGNLVELSWAIGDAWLDGTLLKLFRKWMAELPARGEEACLHALLRFEKSIKSAEKDMASTWGLETHGYVEAA